MEKKGERASERDCSMESREYQKYRYRETGGKKAYLIKVVFALLFIWMNVYFNRFRKSKILENPLKFDARPLLHHHNNYVYAVLWQQKHKPNWYRFSVIKNFEDENKKRYSAVTCYCCCSMCIEYAVWWVIYFDAIDVIAIYKFVHRDLCRQATTKWYECYTAATVAAAAAYACVPPPHFTSMPIIIKNASFTTSLMRWCTQRCFAIYTTYKFETSNASLFWFIIVQQSGAFLLCILLTVLSSNLHYKYR